MLIIAICQVCHLQRSPEHVCARYYDSDGRIMESGSGRLYFPAFLIPSRFSLKGLYDCHLTMIDYGIGSLIR